ncbi:MAG: hypothetical protein CMF48_03095 [Legionellales bacterium]|nr:hypothetical protein [Legionellales bacterium]|tara:strand:+ start:1808 stop:2371 length:564 start_codon:yes stop_codon:yes gene_type:complete
MNIIKFINNTDYIYTIRLRRLRAYQTIEDTGRRDPHEGVDLYREEKQISARANWSNPHISCWSICEDLSETDIINLSIRFKSEYFLLTDVNTIKTILSELIPIPDISTHMKGGKIYYKNDQTPLKTDPVFQKDLKYSTENEYRFSVSNYPDDSDIIIKVNPKKIYKKVGIVESSYINYRSVESFLNR